MGLFLVNQMLSVVGGVVGIVASTLVSFLASCATQPESTKPASDPVPQVIESKPQVVVTEVLPPLKLPGPLDTPEKLLTVLEKSQQSLKSLQAEIKYDVLKNIAGDRQIRFGRWYYEDGRAAGGVGGAGGVRRTAAKFDTLLLGNVKRDEVQIYVFDGEWFVEKRPADKQMIKRRLVKGEGGAGADPLSVDGPLPVPICQKPDRVLNRFDAEVLEATNALVANDPAEQAAFESFVEGCYQLKLTLKPEFQANADIRSVRLWYLPDEGGKGVQPLPRLMQVENRAGDSSFLQLIRAKQDVPIPAEIMDTTVPQGWKADIR